MKTYLRMVKYRGKVSFKQVFQLFSGDVEKDRAYWKKHHNEEARYFELKELKRGEQDM